MLGTNLPSFKLFIPKAGLQIAYLLGLVSEPFFFPNHGVVLFRALVLRVMYLVHVMRVELNR